MLSSGSRRMERPPDQDELCSQGVCGSSETLRVTDRSPRKTAFWVFTSRHRPLYLVVLRQLQIANIYRDSFT